MSDARKRAEEALASALVTLSNKPRYADLFDEVSNLREALRALLAEKPPAPPADAATEAVRVDLLHVIEWLEIGHPMACLPLFEGDGHKAREKAARLRSLLASPAPAPSAKEGM